uniref:Uncharacterized protein n=1 Tax=Vespula pensylvanica TaxID=30213 RepID=A0A834UCP6_VESPE|nr:hypothetical protein H0235_004235 [Vespula pensylvanica]
MGIDPLSDSVGPEFSHGRSCLTAVNVATDVGRSCYPFYRGLSFICLVRRSIGHTDHADFRVESPLARGSPDAATSTW